MTVQREEVARIEALERHVRDQRAELERLESRIEDLDGDVVRLSELDLSDVKRRLDELETGDDQS